jgi:hypothetical protein
MSISNTLSLTAIPRQSTLITAAVASLFAFTGHHIVTASSKHAHLFHYEGFCHGLDNGALGKLLMQCRTAAQWCLVSMTIQQMSCAAAAPVTVCCRPAVCLYV